MALELSSNLPGLRNQGWIRYLQRVIKRKSFIFGFVVIIISSGIVRWSRVKPESTPSIRITKTKGGFIYSLHFIARNRQGFPGYIEKVNITLRDAKIDRELYQFTCDSLREDNQQKIVFSEITVEPKHPYHAQLYFSEQTETSKEFKTDHYYEIIITYTINNSLICFTYQTTKTEVYVFRLNEQDIEFFDMANKTQGNLERVIPLLGVDN